MKILQLVSSLKIGGMERFALDLSQELGQRHEVVLATLTPAAEDRIGVASPSFRRIEFTRRGHIDLSLFWKISALIRREKPDIVHTHMMPLLYASPMIFLGGGHPRFVHTVHNIASREINEIDFLKRLLYGKRVTPVSISSEVLESMKSYWGDIDSPLIFNGAVISDPAAAPLQAIRERIDRCKPTPKTKVVVNVGHISDSKNQLLLNRTARILAQEGCDIVFLVIGRVGDQAYFSKIEQEKADNMFFMGESSEIAAFLDCADYFCLASKYEGLPISLLEAMGRGRVPVCTPAGGIPSVISHQYDGFIARETTPEALAEVFRSALAMPQEAHHAMATQARATFVERFSMRKCAERYLDLYGNLLGRRG